MKLYTKEDFLKAAEFCEVSMIDAKYIIERIDEVICPIELPGHFEILDEARKEESSKEHYAFIRAVRWRSKNTRR